MRRRWKIEDLQREESEILNFLFVVSARMSCHVVMRLRLLCRFTTLFLFCNIIHRNSTSMKSAVCEIWEIYWNNFSPWLMNSSLCSAVDVCEAFFFFIFRNLSATSEINLFARKWQQQRERTHQSVMAIASTGAEIQYGSIEYRQHVKINASQLPEKLEISSCFFYSHSSALLTRWP